MRIKLTKILPLWVAGMIILAFVVLPHHHHEDLICFNIGHCQQTEQTANHDCDHGGHDQSTSNSSCISSLLQTEVTRSLSMDHSCTGDCHHFSVALITLAGLTDLFTFQNHKDVWPKDVYREKLHCTFFTSDKSGRAPPVKA